MRYALRRLLLAVGTVALCVGTHAAQLRGRISATDGAAVPGVLVSDGLSVCTSGPDGRYTLETPALPAIVRISTPRDYRPTGPFWQHADGTKPADFVLAPEIQQDGFFFVQMTDLHLGRVDICRQFVERLNRFPLPLRFVVATGDLVGGVDTVPVDKAMEQYQRYLDGTRDLKPPLFSMPGNHEHVSFNTKNPAKDDPRYGKGLYRQVLGPMHYSWNWGPYHFLALDGTRLPYAEALGKEQLAWLKADLALTPTDTPLVLFCHQSLLSLRDRADLLKLLAGRKVVAGLCGHLHETWTKPLADFPVYQTGAVCGSWWSGANPDGTPQGFALVKLQDGKATYAYSALSGEDSLYVSSPDAGQIRQGTMPVEVVVLDLGRPVAVTATVGDKTTSLECRDKQEFYSVWNGQVDTTAVPDGLMAMTVTATRGESRTTTEMRYLVLNGKEAPFTAKADAVLKCSVRGVDADDEVWLDGQRLGTITKGTANNTVLEFPIPAASLKRVTKVTFRAGGDPKNKDDFSIGPVTLHYGGKRIHDIRYVSFARHSVGDNKPKSYGPERDLYFCLP